MVFLTDYFKPAKGAQGQSSTKRKPMSKPKEEPEFVNLDSDDDDGAIQQPAAKRQKKVESSPKKSPLKAKMEAPIDLDTPVKKDKASPKKVNTPTRAAPKPAVSASTPTSGVTASDVLLDIPDAPEHYLHIDAAASKQSYFQLMANKANSAPSTGDYNVPEGRPNCLNGLTIVFTGTMPNLDRTQAEDAAKRYGAKVTKSVSGKTSLVVIGNDAGPKKLETIKKNKIKTVDEDGFIELIKRMPPDGGDGQAAQQALAKKKEQERVALENAIKEEEEDREKAKLLEKKRAESSKSDSSVPAPKKIVSDSNKLWTVKYAPTKVEHICGNKGNVQKLQQWLTNWFTSSGAFNERNQFRAVLISGPPGIGKTTSAHLIAESLGYDVLEKNASDVRSKSLLNDQLKVCLNNTSVVGYFAERNHQADSNAKKFVLIMDEVDGMSSGDHGGVAQLAQFCRITKTPMILICNDKSLPKMRQFDRICLDLTWRRPTANEMKSRLMTIAHREGLKLDPNVVDQLVQTTGNDIRQIINIMSTVARTQSGIDYSNSTEIKNNWKKHIVLKPFDITGKLLQASTFAPNSSYDLNEKINLFFNDIDFTPLMIHENYRMTRPSKLNQVPPNKQNLETLKLLEKASNSISEGDIVNSAIRGGEQQWSLLPFFGMMSSVLPCSYICGNVTGRINFTSWLGQNSKRMKYDRLLQELQYHSSTKTNTNNQELRLSYIPFLIKKLINPLITKKSEGIKEVIDILDSYYLTKEDWDAILEYGLGKNKPEMLLKKIDTKLKTEFTREYNKAVHPVIIYKTGDSVTKSKGAKAPKPDFEDVIDDDTDDKKDDEEEKQDDLKKEKLIKVKQRKANAPAKSRTKKKA